MAHQQSVQYSTEPMWADLVTLEGNCSCENTRLHLVSMYDVLRIHGQEVGNELYERSVRRGLVVSHFNREWLRYSDYVTDLARITNV